MNTAFEIVQLSDVQLLELLCSTTDDNVLYSHFVDRFLPHVQKECLKICNRRKIDQHVGQQIAHETFERVRRYKSFKKDGIKIAHEKKAVIIYLNRVSTHLFNDFYNNEKKEDTVHRTYFDDIISSHESYDDIEGLKRKKDISIAIFKKLNPKEKAILLKDIEYKRHNKYLPDDVISVLSQELNIKPDTIRKIRQRAIEKIKKAINEINQN